MATVLRSFINAKSKPNIWYMKTDMQGHDYSALVGGGDLLKRVNYIKSECW